MPTQWWAEGQWPLIRPAYLLHIRFQVSKPKKQLSQRRTASRFGGGRPPTGTPSLAWSSVVIVASLLAGASIVHNIYKPDMTIPPMESASGGSSKDN
ncbi:hypothetical protein PVAP13_1NG103000 [Panicum virgatum]|uniref:Uncharacterized protein n=1 Tax=Panicum virgatum TaxID=38727 RepID=A0A8T0WX27_PANVG|nr:hypothetical protein PVAP13_1NG103000 [Panicum virgatum]